MGAVEPSVRRLNRVEDLLDAVDVLARAGELVGVDLGVFPLTVDVRDAERLAEDEVAVDDRVLVAVERPDRRAGRAVPLRVVLAAVTRAAEAAGRNRRDERHLLSLLAGRNLLLVTRLHGTVRLHRATEVRAAVRDDREARLTVECTVVADVRRTPRDVARL